MDVVTFLESFLERMLAWEVEYHKCRRSDEYKASAEARRNADAEAKEKLIGIFDACLSRKAIDTLAQNRLGVLNTGRPPEFAQVVIADSHEESGGKIFVETFNSRALAPFRRYSIVLEEGRLKINALYGRVNEAAKWSARESI
jgi:hypothetical protein